MYLCLAALSIGIFASCKAKKGVEATFSDLDGSWNIVELNGKVLNPAETNQVIEFDVARHSLSGRAGCNRMMGRSNTAIPARISLNSRRLRQRVWLVRI